MTRKYLSHRSFIALITGLALAVALTGASAAPARADDDAARILAGLVGLAIIGAAIEDNHHDRPTVVHQRNVVVHQPPRHVYQPQWNYRPQYRHQHAYQAPRPHHQYRQPPRREVKIVKKIVNKRVVHVHR